MIVRSLEPTNLAAQPAPGHSGKPFAVVSAMKPQLHGRIRRNVSTLLDLGMEVVVVTIRSRKEFFVGLEHPDLSAHFVDAPTTYSRYAAWLSRGDRRRAAIRALRLDRVRRDHLRSALKKRRHPRTMLRRLWHQPRFTAGGKSSITPFPQWFIPVMVVLAGLVAVAALPLIAIALVVRRLAPGVVRSVSVDGLRRAARRSARLVRLHVWGPLARAVSWPRRAATEAIRRVLLTTNRTQRFHVFWRESERLIRGYAPDLVVSSDLPGLVGASRAARHLGIQQLHDCHELYLESTSFTWYERLILAPIERKHMRRAARVVAVNVSIADEYGERYGVRPTVVRNCAHRPEVHEVRDLRPLAGLEPDADVVLYQGGFSIGRGLDVCVAAMVEAPASAHLVLLGYGPLAAELLELARTHGVADRVHVLGAVPPSELLAYTASATVGLIPYQPVSKNNFYSLPNKIFEYTSVGVPVVASDLPELRRIAVDAGCGVVYDPYDPQSLAKALRTVLESDHLVGLRAAAERFGEENSWEVERQVLVTAFTEICPALSAPGRAIDTVESAG